MRLPREQHTLEPRRRASNVRAAVPLWCETEVRVSDTLPRTWDNELERLDRELDTNPTGRAVRTAAAAVAERGGQVLLVGGVVRDALLGLPTKDFDVEVTHLDLAGLEEVLSEFGEVIQVGRSFGVLRVKGLDVDFSLPRRDDKRGPGHRGFSVSVDTEMGFQQASQRRLKE